jgi:hypothetical protein
MGVHNWFECKVKFVKIDESGKESKVTESYMIDAISFTEAESRISKEMETMVQGAFIITNLKKSNITEIVPSDDESDDRWYKAKVAIIDADELTGKEKKSNQYCLVAAKDINTALSNLELSMSNYIVPYEIASIADTTFMDVFPYFKGEDETEEIPENLTPISEFENNNSDFE